MRCSTRARSRSWARPTTRASGATGSPAARCGGGVGATVHLVNRGAAEVLGRPAHASLAAIGAPVELVVAAVPGPALAAVVEDALGAGARAIVAIPSGVALDPALAERVRGAGAVLLGPNCMGVLDSAAGLELVPEPMPAGAIGLVSQSGQLAMEVAGVRGRGGARVQPLRLARRSGAAGRGAAGAHARRARRHAARRALPRGLRRRPRAAARRPRAARAAGKPVAAARGRAGRGGHARGARRTRARWPAARTRSRRPAPRPASSACARRASWSTWRTPCSRAPALRGRRLAVVADGGGHGALAAGLLERAGLGVAALGPVRARDRARCCRRPPRRGTRSTWRAAASATSARSPASSRRWPRPGRSTACC